MRFLDSKYSFCHAVVSLCIMLFGNMVYLLCKLHDDVKIHVFFEELL